MKAVFQTKISPSYDDIPEQQYHFPRTYLRQASAAVGDWIVYYEPRRATSDPLSRGGRQAYFAIAELVGIRPDKEREGHYYADVRNFLQFDNAVAFKQGNFFFESAMKGADGRTNSGSAQRAVRNIPDDEFEPILRAGFTQDIGETAPALDERHYGFEDEQTPFIRPLVETTITRPFRDIAFARQVGAAYDKRCAMTGLKIINGGGRAEAQAAHIHPVSENGPDSVRNGIALSSTFHWMFDRGLISIDGDFKILQAKSGVPPQIQGMINKSGFLNTPDDLRLQPHRQFLHYHRENKFKG